MILKTVKFDNKDSVSRLFKVFVQPHFEYVTIWRPHLKKGINEVVQHRLCF